MGFGAGGDGYTEMAGETPLVKDPADNRLDVFPGAADDAYTVTERSAGPSPGRRRTATVATPPAVVRCARRRRPDDRLAR